VPAQAAGGSKLTAGMFPVTIPLAMYQGKACKRTTTSSITGKESTRSIPCINVNRRCINKECTDNRDTIAAIATAALSAALGKVVELTDPSRVGSDTGSTFGEIAPKADSVMVAWDTESSDRRRARRAGSALLYIKVNVVVATADAQAAASMRAALDKADINAELLNGMTLSDNGAIKKSVAEDDFFVCVGDDPDNLEDCTSADVYFGEPDDVSYTTPAPVEDDGLSQEEQDAADEAAEKVEAKRLAAAAAALEKSKAEAAKDKAEEADKVAAKELEAAKEAIKEHIKDMEDNSLLIAEKEEEMKKEKDAELIDEIKAEIKKLQDEAKTATAKRERLEQDMKDKTAEAEKAQKAFAAATQAVADQTAQREKDEKEAKEADAAKDAEDAAEEALGKSDSGDDDDSTTKASAAATDDGKESDDAVLYAVIAVVGVVMICAFIVVIVVIMKRRGGGGGGSRAPAQTYQNPTYGKPGNQGPAPGNQGPAPGNRVVQNTNQDEYDA